ncbi:MAG: GtrA family protein [Clostridia bacterium]|nr:GtrA family protein [Clostridia bacterium]
MKEVLHNMKKEYLNRQTVLYIIFGQLTTAVSLLTFYLSKFIFDDLHIKLQPFSIGVLFSKPYLWANVFSWFCSVAFSFVTSKFLVFHCKSDNKTAFKECLSYYGGRLLSLLFQQVGLYALVDKLFVRPLIAKIITGAVVVIINFFFAKFTFYKSGHTPQEQTD